VFYIPIDSGLGDFLFYEGKKIEGSAKVMEDNKNCNVITLACEALSKGQLDVSQKNY
jgi:hypothetical protein